MAFSFGTTPATAATTGGLFSGIASKPAYGAPTLGFAATSNAPTTSGLFGQATTAAAPLGSTTFNLGGATQPFGGIRPTATTTTTSSSFAFPTATATTSLGGFSFPVASGDGSAEALKKKPASVLDVKIPEELCKLVEEYIEHRKQLDEKRESMRALQFASTQEIATELLKIENLRRRHRVMLTHLSYELESLRRHCSKEVTHCEQVGQVTRVQTMTPSELATADRFLDDKMRTASQNVEKISYDLACLEEIYSSMLSDAPFGQTIDLRRSIEYVNCLLQDLASKLQRVGKLKQGVAGHS